MRVFLIIVTVFLFAISCRKEAVSTNPVVGQWNLEEVDRQINGSTSNKKIPNGLAVIIEFGSKNKFNELYENTTPIEYGFLGCGSGSYTLEKDNQIRIRAACMSNSAGQVFVIEELTTTRFILKDESGSKFRFSR